MAHLFRGKDRRLLKKGIECLNAIIKRDQVAANPRKTSAISTRTLMLDYGSVPDPLYAAAETLLTQFQNELTDTK